MSRWKTQRQTTRPERGLARRTERVTPSAPVTAAALAGPRSDLLAAQFPVLSAALIAHQRNVAEAFTEEAYWSIEEGIIRMDERSRLAERAASLGIRPFDAQLLLACALRDWDAQHAHRPRLRPQPAPTSHLWKWCAAVALTAVALDALVVLFLF